MVSRKKVSAAQIVSVLLSIVFLQVKSMPQRRSNVESFEAEVRKKVRIEELA